MTELRGLDALGLARTKTDLHLTNLAEDVFPTPGGRSGGRSRSTTCVGHRGAVEPVTTELMSIRSSTAALGDLYLFWLALDGVDEGRKVTLELGVRPGGRAPPPCRRSSRC